MASSWFLRRRTLTAVSILTVVVMGPTLFLDVQSQNPNTTWIGLEMLVLIYAIAWLIWERPHTPVE